MFQHGVLVEEGVELVDALELVLAHRLDVGSLVADALLVVALEVGRRLLLREAARDGLPELLRQRLLQLVHLVLGQQRRAARGDALPLSLARAGLGQLHLARLVLVLSEGLGLDGRARRARLQRREAAQRPGGLGLRQRLQVAVDVVVHASEVGSLERRFPQVETCGHQSLAILRAALGAVSQRDVLAVLRAGHRLREVVQASGQWFFPFGLEFERFLLLLELAGAGSGRPSFGACAAVDFLLSLKGFVEGDRRGLVQNDLAHLIIILCFRPAI